MKDEIKKYIYQTKTQDLLEHTIVSSKDKKDKEIEKLNKDLQTAIDICNNRQKEIVRLNNIINELEKYIKVRLEEWKDINSYTYMIDEVLDKLKELKGDDK